MKRHIMQLIAFMIIFSAGCKSDEWFDIKTAKNLAVPSTLSDLQALLDNAGLFNAYCPAMGENASDFHYFQDHVSNILSGYLRNSYTWSKEHPNINVPDWTHYNRSGSYARVYCANLILETVDKIKTLGNDVNIESSIRGQALFFRGKAFFELTNVFVPPYNESASGSKYGIPLRLESDITVKSERSSILETYNQIIKDLNESIALLPNTQSFVTRPSKLASYALLARVYLSMENYPEALKYANLCLQGNSTLIDYSKLAYQSTANPFIGYNKEIILYSNLSGDDLFNPQNIIVVNSLYDSYSDNDLRKQVFFNYDSGVGIVTYKGTYSGLGFNYLFNGLATDEMFLIRSECYAREGNVAGAMKDLNDLLKTRWFGAYTDLTAANPDDALRIILRERKKELIFRGVRWSDLRRLNKDPRFVQSFTRTVGGKTYTLEPNSYKYTFPIPDDIIEKTGMAQNPGW